METKVVYVTSEEAKIITFHADDIQTQKLIRHGARHPNESLGRNHSKKEDDVEKFLCEVAEALEKDEARLLLVGPAQAKTRLMTHLEEKHQHVAKRVVGVETIDKATVPQVVHFARNYFTKRSAFDGL